MSLFLLLALIVFVLLIAGIGALVWVWSARKPDTNALAGLGASLGERGSSHPRAAKFSRHPGAAPYTPLAERHSRAL